MAQRTKYEYYDFERFEPRAAVTAGSAAPKIKKAPEKKPQLQLVKKPKLTKKQIKEQTTESFRKTAKITVIALFLFAFFAVAIYSRVELDEINREINNIDAKMSVAESDTTRLQNELNAVISMDKVENFAYNTLGMVKVQDYQVVYVDLSNEDSVVLADGKEVKKAENKTDDIKKEAK